MVDVPIIRNWELFFLEKYGYENRSKVARAFAELWNDTDLTTIEIPGDCLLGGKVFGLELVLDGDDFYTSSLRTVTRIRHEIYRGISHDLMCAVSITGRKYYFYSDDSNAYMRLMLGDLIHLCGLSSTRGYYLDPKDRGKGFL